MGSILVVVKLPSGVVTQQTIAPVRGVRTLEIYTSGEQKVRESIKKIRLIEETGSKFIISKL